MSLVAYEASSSDDDDSLSVPDVASKLSAVISAPHVDESLVIDYKMKTEFQRAIDVHQTTELAYNPRFEDLYAAGNRPGESKWTSDEEEFPDRPLGGDERQ